MKPAKSALNDTNDDGEDDEDFNYMAAAAEEETEVSKFKYYFVDRNKELF